MLLDLLQYFITVPLLQGFLPVQVLRAVEFIVILDMTEAPSSVLIAVAKVDSIPQLGNALLTIHGCGTCLPPFGTLWN